MTLITGHRTEEKNRQWNEDMTSRWRLRTSLALCTILSCSMQDGIRDQHSLGLTVLLRTKSVNVASHVMRFKCAVRAVPASRHGAEAGQFCADGRLREVQCTEQPIAPSRAFRNPLDNPWDDPRSSDLRLEWVTGPR
jgi:hypothetical protein